MKICLNCYFKFIRPRLINIGSFTDIETCPKCTSDALENKEVKDD